MENNPGFVEGTSNLLLTSATGSRAGFKVAPHINVALTCINPLAHMQSPTIVLSL